MKVTPVSDVVGAEVTGIDLAEPLDGETMATLRAALLDFQVLVIRNQTLSPIGQVAFSNNWGELEIPDVNNLFIQEGTMSFAELKGWWTDAGTVDSLLHACKLVADTGANLSQF